MTSLTELTSTSPKIGFLSFGGPAGQIALMHRCHAIADSHGLVSVWCNAQSATVPFYQSLGYRVVGEVFEEAGIDHLRMTKTLQSSSRTSLMRAD
jgi:predicted GNAT family N-acyltransferase